jgi:predicted alpha/beta superfamily hydrolase
MPFILVLLLAIIIAGCQSAEPETVEVPVTVEVTRLVGVPVEPPEPEAVEVTRLVEVPAEPPEPKTVEVARGVKIEVPVKAEATRAIEVAAKQPAAVQIAREMPSLNPMIPIELDSIASSATGRDYTITVVLPVSYMFTEADYPVLFVTDGDFYTIPLAMAAAQMAFGQELPEFITVGIDYGNPDPAAWLELRELDMGAEGCELFLQFFEEELIPYIESNYRADSTNRTLIGHSSGGNFALYGLLHAPDTFSNFIASSPGGAASWMDAIEKLTANRGETSTRLYLSVGDLDQEAIVASVEAFSDALAGMAYEGLEQELAILDDETHLSVRPRAFNNGLRWLFAGVTE